MRRRIFLRWPTFTGLVVGVLFFCLALSPSLLPRTWLFQGVVGGITAVIGYGLGVLVATLSRVALARLVAWRPDERARRLAWRVLLWTGSLAVAFSLGAGNYAQDEVRRLMGLDEIVVWQIPLIPVVAAALAALLLLIARAARLGVRELIALLGRFVPRFAAVAAGLVIGGVIIVAIVRDLLVGSIIKGTVASFGLADGTTPPGISQPLSPSLSGGAESLAAWDTLGRQGRIFVGSAPAAAPLGAFAGRAAKDPIRVYAGLRSAASLRAGADLVVRELERTGAFQREVLAVIPTTGTGWVNEKAAHALEYLHAGDTAIAAMQYSYVPSWLSFLTDRDKAMEAAETLFGAVHTRWAALPERSRPKLVLYGESLGTYGIEKSFTDMRALLSRAEGALLVGPPRFNPIHNQVIAGRDPGSPVWLPVYEGGRNVRAAQDPADLGKPSGPWESPRVVYLQNASDPVIWWDTELLYLRPNWLHPPLGPDVNPRMSWWPIITFWQVVIDLIPAGSMPPGHGHNYGSAVVDGWVAIAPPEAWTSADTARLRKVIDGVSSGA